MGVNLSELVDFQTVQPEQLSGKSLAIDAYNAIYQFLSVIRQPDGTPLKDDLGRVTSHLSGLLSRNANLIELGILADDERVEELHRARHPTLLVRLTRPQQDFAVHRLERGCGHGHRGRRRLRSTRPRADDGGERGGRCGEQQDADDQRGGERQCAACDGGGLVDGPASVTPAPPREG